MKRTAMKVLSLLLACLLIVGLTACGGGTTPAAAPSGGGTTAPSGSGTSAPSGGDAAPANKILNIAVTADDNTLSPANMTGSGTFGVINACMEPLWDITNQGEVIMLLCESVDYDSDIVNTLHLRKDVKFHNGNPFTAADVLFSMKLHANGGASAKPRVQTVDVEATKVIDDYTLELHMLAPTITNWTILSQCMIYDEESYSDEDAALRPNGTGPYKITEYVPGSSITMVRNEDYWGAKPDAERINVMVLAEDAQRVNALETKLVDYAPITTTDFDYVSGLKDMTVQSNYTGNFAILNFNFGEHAIFNHNLDARRAVCHAINREAIMNTVYLGKGKLMHAPIPDYCFDYEDRFNDMTDIYSKAYDPDLAKSLAESSGLTKENVRIITNGTTNCIRMAEMLQGMLQQIGVNAQIFNYDPATVWTMQFSGDGDWDLLVNTSIAPNRRCGDLMVNGVRYRPDMVVEGAFDDNLKYLELAPLCMSLQDEKELSDMLFEVIGRYESNVLSYSLFDIQNFIAFNSHIDPASIRLAVGSSQPRYQDIVLK